MKQTIEEAAKEYKNEVNSFPDRGMYAAEDFYAGAHSNSAKNFHTEGMYSEEEVRKIATDFFYHWWNTEGINTLEGFDEWWKEYKKKKEE